MKKILIVRFSSIGDIVLCSPVIRTVKLQKGVELHFITKDKFAPLVTENPYIDKVWTIKEEITECLVSLKKEQFDLVIDLHKNLRSKRLIFSLGAKSVSFEKLNIQKWLRVFTPINVLPKYHLIDRYFHALEPINVKDDGLGMDFFYNVDRDELAKKISEVSNKYISIVLGATYLTKRVPDNVIVAILERFKGKGVILLGGNDVLNKGKELKDRFPKVINAVGLLSIQESAAVIDYASCVITGDTGMMHIAAALKKPIVSIWGGTHPDLGMYPYYGHKSVDRNISIVNKEIHCSPCSKIGKNHCPKGHFKCLKELDTESVLQAIVTQIGTTG